MLQLRAAAGLQREGFERDDYPSHQYRLCVLIDDVVAGTTRACVMLCNWVCAVCGGAEGQQRDGRE